VGNENQVRASRVSGYQAEARREIHVEKIPKTSPLQVETTKLRFIVLANLWLLSLTLENTHRTIQTFAMAPRVLIVGCGLSGGVTVHYLDSLLEGLQPKFTFWEKASHLGGRMSTHIQYDLEDKPHCDMGAQYITKSSENANDVYSYLIANNILSPLNIQVEGMKEEHKTRTHYVSKEGIGEVVRCMFGSHAKDISFNTELESLNCENGIWVASARNQNGVCSEESFDAVVLAVPPTKFSSILGNWRDAVMDKSFLPTANSVRFSARFAFAAYFPASAAAAVSHIPWGSKYIFDDDVIRFISLENRKCEVQDGSGHVSVLLHTSVPFGVKNIDAPEEDMEALLLDKIETLLPGLGPPVRSHLVNWRESQISKNIGYIDQAACFVDPTQGAPLCLTGDYFTESNFEGCVASGKRAASLLADKLMMSDV
jgi:renalase